MKPIWSVLRFWNFIPIFFTSYASCLPVKTRSPYAIKDTHTLPSKWQNLGPAPGDHVINLQFGLKQHRFEELERILYEVSDPSHHKYGQHLSSTEASVFLKPSEEATTLVEEWLLDHDLRNFNYSPAKDWITISLPVKAIEGLLDTKYNIFHHEIDNDFLIRTLSYSIPRHLHPHIETIQPTNSFWRPKAQDKYGGLPPPAWDVKGRIPTYEELVAEDIPDRGHLEIPDEKTFLNHPTVEEACNRLAISPFCLRTLYGTLDYVPQVSEKNGIGLVNFLGNVNNRSDINMYLEAFRPDAAAGNAAYTFKTELVAGGEDLQTPMSVEQLAEYKGFEGALDAETVLGVSWPVPLNTYNVGGFAPTNLDALLTTNTNEPYLEWLQYMLALENPPPVITISYADEEQTVPPSYAKLVCQAFAELGARGVSVFVASGDGGVGAEGHCFDAQTKKPTYVPSFPASCPYVTSVGATRLFNPEQVGFDARGNFSSGGGFSNYFSRPTYQETAVPAYLSSLGDDFEGRGMYNKHGRGIPDISAQGYHFITVWKGERMLRDGTSASSPTVAGIFALVNDALIREGRPPMGFLNPWLYGMGREGLRDVKIGSARGCGMMGFPALEGWDAVTGLGTPWFPKLKELAMKYRFREGRPWYFGR